MSDTQKHTKPNVPDLRFPGFCGEWEQHLLSEYLEFKNGLNPSAKSFGEGIKFISVMDILNNPYITYDCIRASVNASEKEKQEFNVEYGDILFQRSSETLEDVGHANVYLDKKPALFGGFTIRGKKKGDYNPLFFKYLLDSPKARKKVIVKGAGAQHFNIGQEGLSSVSLYFPSKQEQKKIAELFELLDQRIAIQNKVIEKYESLIKAITRCLVHCNGHQCFLGDIAEIYQPKTITGLEMSNGGQYPVFGANGIIGHYKDYNHASPQICIACRGNTCGVLNYSLPFSWITGNSMVINVDSASGVNKRFLFHLLSTVEYSPLISGSGQPQIVRGPLRKLRITLPDKQYQDKNAQIIDCLIEKSNVEKALLRKLQTQKNFFLTAVFI